MTLSLAEIKRRLRAGQEFIVMNDRVPDLGAVKARVKRTANYAFVVEHPGGAGDPVPGYRAQRITGKAANRAVWQAQIELEDTQNAPARGLRVVVQVSPGGRINFVRSWQP